MVSRLLLASAAFVLGALVPGGGAAQTVAPPFDPGAARGLIGRQIAFGPCAEAPPPVVDLSHLQSRYDPKDPTQSKVDPAREARGKQRMASLDKLVTDVDHLADRFVLSNPPNEAMAACVVHRVAAWARAGALLQGIEENDRLGRHQALMTQAWYGAGLASALVKLGAAEAMKGEEAAAARAWLHMLAKLVEKEYSGLASWLRPDNNHKYWAGYFLGVTAALTDDRTLFASSRDILDQALSDVGPDGSIDKEMSRGARAFAYQQFATLPIMAMVVMADRNGAPISEDEWQVVRRLATFAADAAADPGIVEAKTGVVPEAAGQSFNFAWIDMILPLLRPRDRDLAHRLEMIMMAPRMRPAWHVFLGGDVTSAYNPKAMVRPPLP